jgi:hypothetical protein
VNILMTSSYMLPIKCYTSENVLSFEVVVASKSCNL